MGDTLGVADTIAKSLGNVHLLDMQSIEIEGVVFLGTTLWSNINPGAKSYINDFKRIRGMTPRFL